jgi:radical SAM protein with 4Fe4S-binding SPASM domain
MIGGEPSLWPYIAEVNAFCSEHQLESTIVTNGTRFADDAFWNAYRTNPCSCASVSIKGFDEASFFAITHSRSFSATAVGIRRALSTNGSIASLVFDGCDTDALVRQAIFAVECGASGLGISPSTPVFHDRKADPALATKPTQFVSGVLESYTKLNSIVSGKLAFALKLPLCLWPKEFVVTLIERGQIATTCQLQHRSGLVFTHDGTLISCNSLFDFPMGKLGVEFIDEASLSEHLRSQAVDEFYSTVNCYASSKCLTCPVRNFCGGGCALFYAIYSGEQMIPGWN